MPSKWKRSVIHLKVLVYRLCESTRTHVKMICVYNVDNTGTVSLYVYRYFCRYVTPGVPARMKRGQLVENLGFLNSGV